MDEYNSGHEYNCIQSVEKAFTRLNNQSVKCASCTYITNNFSSRVSQVEIETNHFTVKKSEEYNL